MIATHETFSARHLWPKRSPTGGLLLSLMQAELG